MEEHYLSSDFVHKDYRQYRLAKEHGHIFVLKISEATSFHHNWKEKQSFGNIGHPQATLHSL
jgi:hypothetical protein